MKSLTIEKCTKFNVCQTLALTLNGKTAGSISPDNTTPTLNIEGTKLLVFSATLLIDVKENIVVDIQGTETALSNYKTANDFTIYYAPGKNILILDTPSPIAKKFATAIKQAYPDDIEFQNCTYDFEKITRQTSTTKALYFEVDDSIIDSKGFFGDDIHNAPEAAQAIKQKNATYLVAEIDVLNKTRTVGFSQKGTLVFYSKPIDLNEDDYPYVQLSLHCADAFSN